MSSVQRYREGPQKRAKGRIAAGVKIEIGDLVGVDLATDYVVPASAYLNANIAVFRALFAGVLVEGATSGTETVETPCVIEYNGTYEYPLNVAAAAENAIGTPAILTTGSTNLQNQVLALGARATAIALVARQIKQGDTSGWFQIVSCTFDTPLS